jgi:hypothetical protein
MIFPSRNSPSFFRLGNSAALIRGDRRSRMRQDELAEHKKPQLANLDPAPFAFSALTTGTVTTTDHMFTAEFLRKNIFLHEFLLPHGVDGTLG